MVNTKEKDERTVCRCAYCEMATPLPTKNGDENDMLCEKYGVVRADYSCRKFRYDLLKRAPREKPRLGSLNAVSLED